MPITAGRSCVPQLRAGGHELLPHVELVHFFDRMPVHPQVQRHFLDRGAPALLADEERITFCVVGIGREPIELLTLHAVADSTVHPPQIEFQIDARVAAREIAHAPRLPVVPGALRSATRAADRFFGRRVSVITRARGSFTRPRITRAGTNPGKRYASRSSRVERRRTVMHELHAHPLHRQVPISPLTACTTLR